ncbi:MAG: alpha/beta fold hydrolase [Bacteroidota bacterium]|nr:alpha/beta fold hydrolase [Bacteroidota bacterium]
MDILFLHGALGCKQHWMPLIEKFKDEYNIHNIDFVGHGINSEETDITLDDLVDQIKRYVQTNIEGNFTIVGYSLGGYVGLKLALQNIEGLKKLICIATQLDWDEVKALNENKKITTENFMPIKEKLASEHQASYEAIIKTTHNILESIGKKPISPNSFERNQIPLYFLIGEKDKMVNLDFTKDFCLNISNSTIFSLQNQPHLLEKMDVEVLTQKIKAIIGVY